MIGSISTNQASAFSTCVRLGEVGQCVEPSWRVRTRESTTLELFAFDYSHANANGYTVALCDLGSHLSGVCDRRSLQVPRKSDHNVKIGQEWKCSK